MPRQAKLEERRELRRGAGPLKAGPRILLPRGVRYGGRPAGLLTRGSPFAAFPACASGVVAKSNSPYSGGAPPRSPPGPLPRAPFAPATSLPHKRVSPVSAGGVGRPGLFVVLAPPPPLPPPPT